MSPSPDFSLEEGEIGVVCGIDEAGRGPWAGPVVAAAVILDPMHYPSGLNDSKKLSAARRVFFYDKIMESAKVGVGVATAAEIDALNILRATLLAMRRAYDDLPLAADVALVDGNRAPDLPCRVRTVIGGDATSLSIAAASIIAKVTRDRMMEAYAREFPYYGWEKNAGYGTKAHQEGLSARGVSIHHRKSFAPIRALLEETVA